jgi:hypothetical protein
MKAKIAIELLRIVAMVSWTVSLVPRRRTNPEAATAERRGRVGIEWRLGYPE